MADWRPTRTLPLLAECSRPTVSSATRLAVIADPHVSPTATGTWKQYHHAADRFREALADAADRDVDAILLLGDLTKDGTPAEFELVDEILDAVDVPLVAIPGNHDVEKEIDEHDSVPVAVFAERYSGGQLPFAFEVGDITVFGIDSATAPDGSLRQSAAGYVDETTISWLADRLPEADAPIVALHHNTPGIVGLLDRHFDEDEADVAAPSSGEWDLFLRNPDPLRDVLVDNDVALVLTGHLHVPAVGAWGPITEVMATATGSFPQGYLLLDVDEAGSAFHYVPIGDDERRRKAYWSRVDYDDLERWLTAIASIELSSIPRSVR